MSLLGKFHASLQSDGWMKTIQRSLRHARETISPGPRDEAQSPADVFTRIFQRNEWHNGESVSGHGSSLAYTANLRKELPALFTKHAIRSVFDAPCGDFNWMRQVVKEDDIDYRGGDIVRELVESNTRKYDARHLAFSIFDITIDEFPRADVWLCRDCLFHLSYSDIYKALANFSRSQIPFLLTTTHLNPDRVPNRDIRSGGYRTLDLFSPPFSLPTDVAHRIADWIEPFPPREVCLWTRAQVAGQISALRDRLGVKP